ncbi:tRNA pseudouridine(55) synthase TruB [Planctomycetaceae bacterium SH139]
MAAGLQGILNCHKPVGWTSRDVVNRVYRQLKPAKVGHAGTLDPLAEGVLVVPVGPAARLVPYLHLYAKSYRVRFQLGSSSASGDLETPLVAAVQPPVPSLQALVAAAASLTGTIEQIPPAHSAVKIAGQPAYKAARKQQAVVMRPRQVVVEQFTIAAYQYPLVDAEITCGSGTYIRSLGIDLAARLGTTAVMTHLTRTAVGPFAAGQAVAIDGDPDTLRQQLVAGLRPLVDGVGMLGRFELDAGEVEEVIHGRSIRDGWQPAGASPGGEWAGVDRQGVLRAILIAREGSWGPKRVFPAGSPAG